MADFTLRTGKEITFDLEQLTEGEWEDVIDGKVKKQGEHKVIAKVSGLTLDEVRKLTVVEYSQLVQAFVLRAINPLAIAASKSESTSS